MSAESAYMFVVEHVIAERWPVGHAPAGVNIASKEIVIGGTETAEVRVISKEARVVEEFVVGKATNRLTCPCDSPSTRLGKRTVRARLEIAGPHHCI